MASNGHFGARPRRAVRDACVTWIIGRSVNHRVWLPMLLELGVLGLGLLIDGKIGVGVFPNAKEFFVRFAGGCVVAHQSLRPTELKPGQWAGDIFPAQTGIVDQLLEFARCRSAIA